MLDINLIRENPEKVKVGIVAKGYDSKIVDKVLLADRKKREIQEEAEMLRAKRNKLAKIGKGTPEAKKLKERLKLVEQELRKAEEEFQELMLQVPNFPAPDVSFGKDESENKVIRSWGEPKEFGFKPKDHLELGELLDIIDVKRAGKVSGSRFGYLKNEGAILEFALVQLAFETLVKEGFIPVVPTVMIKKETMRGMGYLEHGGKEDMYILENDGLVLVGTSEQSIGPMHQGEVFEEKDLPRRYLGFSSCFRREAGAYGKDTRGILRVHQFDKVEMFSFTKPDQGDREHEYLLSLEEKLVQLIEVPYRVVKMCTGDLGAPAARKYDIECWIPSQEKYRETHSTSTCTDFQARRLNIRYKTTDNRQQTTEFVHTLNGTAFAIGRTLIAILENYQQKDGSVLVPKTLQKYTGFEKISPKG
ncbi:MAG: serine--tRNA ligase [Patescibacteria group bacterium]